MSQNSNQFFGIFNFSPMTLSNSLPDSNTLYILLESLSVQIALIFSRSSMFPPSHIIARMSPSGLVEELFNFGVFNTTEICVCLGELILYLVEAAHHYVCLWVLMRSNQFHVFIRVEKPLAFHERTERLNFGPLSCNLCASSLLRSLGKNTFFFQCI